MIEAVGARPVGSLQEVYVQAGQASGQLPDPSPADRQAFEVAMERAEAQAQIEPSTRSEVVAAAADNPWIVPPIPSGASHSTPDIGVGERLVDTLVEVREVWDTQRGQVESMRADPANMSQTDMVGLLYDIQQSTMVYGMVVNEVSQVDSKIEGILRTA